MKSTEMTLGVVPRAPRNMGLGNSPQQSLTELPSDHFQIAIQQASSLVVIKETKAQNETGSHILSAGDCTSAKSTAH